MKTYQKHHYPAESWKLVGGGSETCCARCGVRVRLEDHQVSIKFWVGSKWSSKRPPCQVDEKFAQRLEVAKGIAKGDIPFPWESDPSS